MAMPLALVVVSDVSEPEKLPEGAARRRREGDADAGDGIAEAVDDESRECDRQGRGDDGRSGPRPR